MASSLSLAANVARFCRLQQRSGKIRPISGFRPAPAALFEWADEGIDWQNNML